MKLILKTNNREKSVATAAGAAALIVLSYAGYQLSKDLVKLIKIHRM